MRKYLLLVFSILILSSSINAFDTSKFDFTYPTPTINNNTYSVNHSTYSETADTALNWFTDDGGLLGDVGDILHSDLSNLAWSVAGHIIDTHFLPDASLSYDLGSGPNRWRWLYVSNISAEYIDTFNLSVSSGMINGINISNLSSDFIPYTGATGNIDLNKKNVTGIDFLNISGDLQMGGGYAFGDAGGWIAVGSGAEAGGGDSFAFGTGCDSGGGNSVAMGYYAITDGNGAISMGQNTYSYGQSAVSMGEYTNAFGEHSTAMGYSTNATGNYSTSIGSTIVVDGNYSVGIGLNSTSYNILNNNIFSIMGGKVGIGETNPQQELVVKGDLNVTELIYGNGSQLTGISTYNSTYAGLINNASYLSTYNSTYNDKADYQFLDNNFNGSGTINSGNMEINSAVSTLNLNSTGRTTRINFIRGDSTNYAMRIDGIGTALEVYSTINAQASWQKKLNFNGLSGFLDLKGSTPSIAQQLQRATGGYVFDFFAPTIYNTVTTGVVNAGKVGLYGGIGTPSTVSYMYFDPTPTGAYNNALMKLAPAGVGIGLSSSTSPSYPLEVKGNVSGISAWFEANISATGYNERTSVYDKSKGNALDNIYDSDKIKNIDGSLNHSLMDGGECYLINDTSRPILIDNTCSKVNGTDDEVCLFEYPYLIEECSSSMSEQVDKHEQALFELKQKNEMLEQALCNLGQTQFCKFKDIS